MTVKSICKNMFAWKASHRGPGTVVQSALLGMNTQNPVMQMHRKLSGWLVCLQGPHKGQDFRIWDGETKVGADPFNDLVLTGPDVRSHHAVFQGDATHMALKPAKMGHKISLNGADLIASAALHDGDDISLGQMRFQYRAAAIFQPGYRPLYRQRSGEQLVFSMTDRLFVTGWMLPLSRSLLPFSDLRLTNRPTLIGAAENCAFRFNNCGLDAQHARLTFESQRLMLEPLQPEKAPCFVNGHQVAQKTALSDSDQLTLAHLQVVIKTW